MSAGNASQSQSLSPKSPDAKHSDWQWQVVCPAAFFRASLWVVLLPFLLTIAHSQVIPIPNLVVQLGWEPNQESDLAGYRLHYGFEPRKYIRHIDVGNTNRAYLNLPIPETVYYLAVSAYDTDGLESTYSNEVVHEARGVSPIETTSKSGSTSEDTPFEIPLDIFLGNPLADWFLTKSPAFGRVDVVGGKLTYIPEADFTGPSDTFEVVLGVGSALAIRQKWLIEILGENDPPAAFDLWVSTQPNTPMEILLEGHDPEGGTLTYQLLTQPKKGTLTGTPPLLVYTPGDFVQAEDAFTYLASDGNSTSTVATVQIEITSDEIEPYARDSVLSLNEDEPLAFALDVVPDPNLTIRISEPPSFGNLLGSPPNLIYVPSTNFFGTDIFVFEVEDTVRRIDVAVVMLEVVAINDPPLALPQQVTVPWSEPAIIRLTGSDPDPDDEQLSFEIVERPSNGSLTGRPPSLRYEPSGEARSDAFSFRVFDGTEYSPPAVVTLTPEKPPFDGLLLAASVNSFGNLVLRWNCIATRSYEILFREAIQDAEWILLTSLTVSKSGFHEYQISFASGGQSGFYLIRLLPP